MSKKKFTCPVQGCTREAKRIDAWEEVLMPVGMPNTDLKRKPPHGELGRNFHVECPVHGIKTVQEIGHHISNIPQKSEETAIK
jgi:hypothetical protein